MTKAIEDRTAIDDLMAIKADIAAANYARTNELVKPVPWVVEPKIIERPHRPKSKHAGGWMKSPRRGRRG